MKLEFFNTLTRRKEIFQPLDEEKGVRFYTCGPTVYNNAHIGNFRAYIFEDLLRRALCFAGYRVTQVMNLTDVDDKTIRGAREAGLSLKEYTRPFIEAFFADLRTLNIARAEHYPAATDYISEMIDIIARLLERGLAYRSDDGSVYFSVARFPTYGRLARLDMSGLKPGARVAQDEYDKEGVGDFALWKAWTEADGDVAWDAPWGRGRPGWHIECSAMSMRFLGPSFDLHTGGIDNLFPHHENEIAQSEGATGLPYVQTWMHCAHLRVNGEKMAKSLGNVYTLRQLLERGYSGREIRYVLLAGHYRQALNFTFDGLTAARNALMRVDAFRERLTVRAGDTPASELPDWADRADKAFRHAIANDLGLPEALSALFDMVHVGNRALDNESLDPAEAAAVQAALDAFDQVLGVLAPPDKTPRPDVAAEALLAARAMARAERRWADSDRLREELSALGWEVRDTPQGQKLRPRLA